MIPQGSKAVNNDTVIIPGKEQNGQSQLHQNKSGCYQPEE